MMQDGGTTLNQPRNSTSIAMALFHSYFVRKRFAQFSDFDMVIAFLFLSDKIEESSIKLWDIVIAAREVIQPLTEIDKEGQEYMTLRKRVFYIEILILETVCFDLNIIHPYDLMVEIVKQMNGTKMLAQLTWVFINDSYLTTPCLLYQPKELSIAAIYLGTKWLRHNAFCVTGVETTAWWVAHGVTIKRINGNLPLHHAPTEKLAV